MPRSRTQDQVQTKSKGASQSRAISQVVAYNRSKRTKINFEDPLYEQQWHLHGGLGTNWTVTAGQKPLLHLNIRSAWESGVTGQGVTVCVIDDGLEWNHEDIRDNYNSQASYDLNADDPDPSPASNGENNEHGTRCAGEIAGVANSVCGVGVAYRASVSGLRVLGGRVTDSMEALAFSHQIQKNHVFSCSWGPEDDGATVDGPRALGRRALRWGTTYGRKGRGAVYVVASGNGGDVNDNCNYDGYANSVYTVTIGAVNSIGRLPFYAEWCAAMLAVAPSSGLHGKDIVSTQHILMGVWWWWGCGGGGGGGGSSSLVLLLFSVLYSLLCLVVLPVVALPVVALPVVALPVVALPVVALPVVALLVVALPGCSIDDTHQDWTTNAAGLHHSHHYGFGLLDASAMVSAAAVWETLPFSSKYVGAKLSPHDASLDAGTVNVSMVVHSSTLDRVGLRTLETVEVRVWLTHEYRGSVGYTVVCPSGTSSILAPPRLKDTSTAGLSGWPLVTVRCWAESPGGLYQLRVEQSPQLERQMKGQLVQWQLVLYGSSASPSEVMRRHKVARAAMRGETVVVGNRSHLCHPVPPLYPPSPPIPASWLKVRGGIVIPPHPSLPPGSR
ncbi:Peptidase S8/S53 domain [Trinorchestia longiramus]|nr:Peptidase S8/S53 domain [Trinorchestia longiramus]